jgi:hypothetical protein
MLIFCHAYQLTLSHLLQAPKVVDALNGVGRALHDVAKCVTHALQLLAVELRHHKRVTLQHLHLWAVGSRQDAPLLAASRSALGGRIGHFSEEQFGAQLGQQATYLNDFHVADEEDVGVLVALCADVDANTT